VYRYYEQRLGAIGTLEREPAETMFGILRAWSTSTTRLGTIMWSRGVAGFLFCVVGVIWIAQGTNVLHGSGMSGHGMWAVLGAVAVVVGVALLIWAWRIRRRTPI
jgi:uncharacterized membrane protein HdeD (DUF308 family)